MREQTFTSNLNPSGGEFIGDWSLWSNGEILLGNTISTSNYPKKDTYSKYLTLGIDKPFRENGVFGLAFTYGEDDITVGNLGSGMESKNLSLNIYNSNLINKDLPLETQIGFGKMNIRTKRIDNFIFHKGDRDAYMIFGSTKILAKPKNFNNFQLTPYGKLDLSKINFNEFSESGSSLALTFKNQTVNRKTISLGLDVNRDVNFHTWTLKPFLGFSYGYDFTGASVVDMNYVGDSQNYRFVQDKLSSNNWNINIGFDFFRDNDWSGSISYDYERAGSSSDIDSYQFNISWFF